MDRQQRDMSTNSDLEFNEIKHPKYFLDKLKKAS